MKTHKCTVCNTKFEAKRSDAQYCSNSCKQKGSVLKRMITENQEPKQKRKFSAVEYKKVVDEVGYMDNVDFIDYCYFRQVMPENATLKQVTDYIESISNETVRDVKRTKAFTEFHESFFVDCEVVE